MARDCNGVLKCLGRKKEFKGHCERQKKITYCPKGDLDKRNIYWQLFFALETNLDKKAGIGTKDLILLLSIILENVLVRLHPPGTVLVRTGLFRG